MKQIDSSVVNYTTRVTHLVKRYAHIAINFGAGLAIRRVMKIFFFLAKDIHIIKNMTKKLLNLNQKIYLLNLKI